ncbi:PASTA domain-containing protein [Actinomyces stomatis]|uniref:PASTA domain-containing protein n=1 Tax=Actinomyces stomatis TaxID=3050227 RepID=UPI002852B8CA|nr:PASTA domain-containing protein [Actinomyces sp. PK606]
MAALFLEPSHPMNEPIPQSTATTAAQAASTTSASLTMPDLAGMTGDKVAEVLKAAGITPIPSFKDEAGEETVIKWSNWSVTGQTPSAGASIAANAAVTLTVHHDSADAAASAAATKPQTTQGLDGVSAAQVCGNEWESSLQKQFPSAKVKAHWIADVYAQEYKLAEDSWYIKMRVSVDKADFNAECTASGSEESPVVQLGPIY